MRRVTRGTAAGRAYLELQNEARRQGRPTQELLTYYAIERWLARLAGSRHANSFVLKGGVLLAALGARRATVDADLLGRRLSSDEANIMRIVSEVAGTSLEVDDGMLYDSASIEANAIREGDHYSGLRVSMTASLATAKLKLRLDINFGDPVTPAPQRIKLPSLRDDLPDVGLLGYPIETILAEKLCTAMTLGAANTRVRDYADLFTLITRHDLHYNSIKLAFDATVEHRGAALQPFAEAVSGFAELRQVQYRIYRESLGNQGEHLPQELSELTRIVTAFAAPLTRPPGPHPTQWESTTRQWSKQRVS